MNTISTLSYILGGLMVLKIVSSLSLFVSLDEDTDKIEFYGIFFLFGTGIIGFLLYVLSLEISRAVANDLNLWLEPIVRGSYKEINSKLPKPIGGLSFLMVSSVISLIFPYLVTFLLPFMKKNYKDNAIKRLPHLTGIYPIIFEGITLTASILGIVSFYFNFLQD